MSNYALKRFANVDILRSVSPKHLVSFLQSHAEYLTLRQIEMPESEEQFDAFDYSSLVEVLLTPTSDTPTSMIDSLYYVNEMATEAGMDAILRELAQNGRFIDESDSTPVDIAVQAWMMDFRLVERAYARLFVHKPKTFLHFYADASSSGRFSEPADETLRAMEGDFDDWFEEHKRGRSSRVLVFPRDEDFCFLIRRGEPNTRVPCIHDGESSSLTFRPEKHDVVVYKPGTGELRINSTTKGIRDLYRRAIGKYVFGNPEHFPDCGRYTLKPLRTDGARSLVHTGIQGIVDIKLTEIQFDMGGAYNTIRTIKADDVFAMLQLSAEEMPEDVAILKASFRIWFSDSKRPRTVVIKPSNVAQYLRDGDGDLIEQWLRACKFIMDEEEEESDEVDDFMVGAV